MNEDEVKQLVQDDRDAKFKAKEDAVKARFYRVMKVDADSIDMTNYISYFDDWRARVYYYCTLDGFVIWTPTTEGVLIQRVKQRAFGFIPYWQKYYIGRPASLWLGKTAERVNNES